ncbi:hypothetical protein [Palaeococcus pacificus]|uniref:hypothetical protein n=1 Tax=Palaeococcus pacificus TaxID=971279 RepID=UPI001186EFA5|nr:hypothetical protein [Palaeococcus pacificus]
MKTLEVILKGLVRASKAGKTREYISSLDRDRRVSLKEFLQRAGVFTLHNNIEPDDPTLFETLYKIYRLNLTDNFVNDYSKYLRYLIHVELDGNNVIPRDRVLERIGAGERISQNRTEIIRPLVLLYALYVVRKLVGDVVVKKTSLPIDEVVERLKENGALFTGNSGAYYYYRITYYVPRRNLNVYVRELPDLPEGKETRVLVYRPLQFDAEKVPLVVLFLDSLFDVYSGIVANDIILPRLKKIFFDVSSEATSIV